MPEDRGRYPTLEEFWKRLDVRDVEEDLREDLRGRLTREARQVSRVGRAETVAAVAARLVPGDVPATAIAAFLDERFDQQLGRGDEKSGAMPRAELIPAGFQALDDAAREAYGATFDAVPPARQDALLALAERGKLPGPKGFDPTQWFKRTLELALLGFGSDPRGMVQMGFPGPSYRPGHIWLDSGEVSARARRKLGYLEL